LRLKKRDRHALAPRGEKEILLRKEKSRRACQRPRLSNKRGKKTGWRKSQKEGESVRRNQFPSETRKIYGNGEGDQKKSDLRSNRKKRTKALARKKVQLLIHREE